MSFEWSEVEVGQVCNITSSKRIFAHEYVERGVPFYGSKEIIDKALGTYPDTTVFISNARFAEIAAKFGYPEEGDLLLSSVGNRAGIPYVIKDEGKFYFKDGNLTWFKEFNGLNSSFLCHWMKSAIGQSSLHSIMIGSAQKALTITGLLKLRICLPSIRQQERIVAILNALDDRITLLRETNVTLEAIAQALFKSWFVDFDPVRAKLEGRTPEGMDEVTAALFPDGFEVSELGLIPRGWRIGKLEDILALRSERTSPNVETALLPYVPIDSIPSKNPFLNGFKSGEEANSSLVLFCKDDILFGAMRPYFHKVCQAPFNGVTRATVFALRSKNARAAAYALFVAFQECTVAYATQHSEGSTIPYAKWPNSFEKMPLLLPPKEIQEGFSLVVSELIEKANSSNQQSQTLATLRDTLLPRLISGQLRLPEVESLTEESVV